MDRVSRIFAVVLVLAGIFLASRLNADSWMPPRVQSFKSADGRLRFTVTPRDIQNPLRYFEDKVENVEPAGQRAGGQASSSGRLERRESGRWRLVWERPLVNDVAPVEALVADDAQHVVTFDNWHSMGHGDNVVVLYAQDGTIIRSLRLDEILPRYFIDALPRSVSSIGWRAEGSSVDSLKLRLSVVVPSLDPADQTRDRFVVEIDLATGAVSAIDESTLARLRPIACQRHRQEAAQMRAWLQRERDGLRAPSIPDPQAWETYTVQAGLRLFPRESLGSEELGLFGEATTMRLPEVGEFMYSETLDLFREFLRAHVADGSRRLFSGIRQDALALEVENAARDLQRGQLAGVEMVFIADQAHWRRISVALSDSGATLRHVDPSNPIPPRPERLAEHPPEPVIDPVCELAEGPD